MITGQLLIDFYSGNFNEKIVPETIYGSQQHIIKYWLEVFGKSSSKSSSIPQLKEASMMGSMLRQAG